MSWNLSSTVWYESSWDRSNTAGLGSPLPPGLSPKKHGEPERSTSISFSRCHQTQPTQPTHHDLLTSTFPSIKGHTGTLRVVSAVGLLADRVVAVWWCYCLVSFFLSTNREGEKTIDSMHLGHRSHSPRGFLVRPLWLNRIPLSSLEMAGW